MARNEEKAQSMLNRSAKVSNKLRLKDFIKLHSWPVSSCSF